MKVVSPKQMVSMESLAYRDGSSDADFMEEAGSGVALVVHELAEHLNLNRQIFLFCGKGNNAGDAYVAGIYLLHLEYEVLAYSMFPIEDCSTLCKENYARFVHEGGRVLEVNSPEEMVFPTSGMIIDGLFGTGFKGRIEEPLASFVQQVNQSKLPIISVDIPSGLNGETGEVLGTAVTANFTAFLGLPKTGFFLLEGWNHVGKLAYVDFGLPQQYIEESDADLIMMSPDIMKSLLPTIIPNRHKYQAGYVVGLSGSPEYPGAAILSAWAALRGGAGIVRVLYPQGMEAGLAASPYEIIKSPYDVNNPQEVLNWMNQAAATYIGPGIGLSEKTRKLINALLPQQIKPCVIDADALTILSEGKTTLPKNAILTPHLGELKRLLKITEDVDLDLDFLRKCQEYVNKNHVTLILKGGPTFVFHYDEPIYVCPHGDPGMATAGSGDVLTGLIASLLAQGLSTHHAALLGVYLHGIAGEYAAQELTSYCMNASDIIEAFPQAFLFGNQ